MRVDVEQQNKLLKTLQQNQVASTQEPESMLSMIEQATETYAKDEKMNSFFQQDATYLDPTKEEKKTVLDKVEDSTQLDAATRKDQMAVLSHTTSEADYKKMQEEGFTLDATASNTIVTVTDEIKVQMAKAGKDVSAYGDSLSDEELEAVTGNAAVANQVENQISEAMKEADIPATEENVKSVEDGLKQAQALQNLSDGAIKYLLDNGLEPTIENIYLAEHSGSISYNSKDAMDIPGLTAQIEKVIRSAGLEVTDETVKSSQWLVANQIPLTKENLAYLEELKNIELPVSDEVMIDRMVEAIAEGKTAQTASLVEGYSLKEQAEQAVSVVNNATDEDLAYIVNNGLELTVENLEEAANFRGQNPEAYTEKGLELLTAQRQLEEARLAMSAQANYALLKQGISIDTKPLVALVEDLKNAENMYYENLLKAQGVEVTEENVALFAETSEKLQEVKSVPAYVLGVPEANTKTLQGVYEEGTALKAAMQKANQSYETLMTAPRSDLGDSIQKAFQNVDVILDDLGLEPTEANERAVRILGYNNIEITVENIMEMKAADKEVQRVFQNMTPAVVTEMIKRGINPLEMEFPEINKIAEEIKNELGSDEKQRFSEYLYHLEENHEISAEERETYIGVYRLIHQVAESDGAATGALIKQGADLTLKNLLTAVRSKNKTSKMDVSVDEEFGEQTSTTKFNSITDQIMSAYQTNCAKEASDLLTPGKLQSLMEQHPDWENMTPEQFAECLAATEESAAGVEANQSYIEQQLAQLEHCASSSEEIYQILQQYDLPNTMLNVMALESMMSNRNQLFRQIFENEKSDGVTEEDIQEMKEIIIEEFGEAIAEPRALAEVQETLAEVAEKVMKNWMGSDEITSIDVREMRLMQAKLSMNNLFAKDEKYSVPVLVGDKVTNVSLKIVRGVDPKGIVDVMFESEATGKVAATFQAKEDGISGFIASDNRDTRELLAENSEKIEQAVQGEQNEQLILRFAYMEDLDLNRFSGVAVSKNMSNHIVGTEQPKADKASETYQVQTSRLYHIAESFIRAVKELA